MLPNTTEKTISERHFLEAIWRRCSGLLRVFIFSMKAEGTLTFDVGEEQKPTPPPPPWGVKDGLNETRLIPYLRPKPEKWDRFKAKTKTTSLTWAHKTSLNRFPNRNS